MSNLYTQENCDPDDPKQHALWALMHLPSVGGAPMITHPQILQEWSKRLWDAGFRHNPELQTVKYITPRRGGDHVYNASGGWVPMDTPEPPQMVIPDVNRLTPEENELMIAQYRASGMIPDASPEPRKALVIGDDS